MVCEEIYFEAYNDYILLKDNIAQLYFILGRADLLWNFFRYLQIFPTGSGP